MAEKFTSPIKAVEIRAELRQIRTMVDGSINVILNLPEDCKEQVKVFLDWIGLEVGVLIVAPEVKKAEEKYGL